MENKRLKESKVAAWGAMLLAVAVIGLTFAMRPVWWACIDMFFMFMAAFCHLAAVYLRRLNAYAGRKLDMAALICGVLMMLSFIGEYVAFRYIV